MLYKTIIFILASSILAAQGVLDRYIQQALDSNLALQQADFSYQKSIAALREARGLFLPAVDIQGRYSRADGGRMIEFPVGDLLNPIYQTLNYLAGLPVFPTNLPNQSFRFLREREHDTHVRVVQPVLQPKIYHNYKIHQYAAKMEGAARSAFARQLVAETKVAYYNFLTAIQVVELANRTQTLLEENLRVSESLHQNQKATIDVVYRARAELSRLQQRQAEATKLYELSKAYFNFLLNRPLDATIDIEDVQIPDECELPALPLAEESALQHREELQQLGAAIDAQQHGVRLNRANFLPTLAVVFDYGYQGEEYIFNDQYDYWMASAVFSWNLFDGGQDRAKIQQAKIEQAKMQVQLQEAQKQIQLDVRNAYEDMRVVIESIDAAREEQVSAAKNFELVSKKWQQGMAPQIEFLDAQNIFTQAELHSIIVNYDYFIKKAELEKAMATFELPIAE
jgi:outer membrane protein